MDLGERISSLRAKRNLSQGELAEMLEVSRQSVSKWETGTSVPELDKLVRLSEVFGISLDELVLDKKPEEAPKEAEPKVIYVEKREQDAPKKTAGVVLLCFAAVVWLLITLFGDILAGFILALPFAACGLICLWVRKHPGLWCAWAVYLFVELYLRFATGINWQFVFLPQVYAGGHPVHLIVAWTLLAVFGLLTGLTSFLYRQSPVGPQRKNAVIAGTSWAVYFLIGILSIPPFTESEQELGFLIAYSVITSVSGWVRGIVLVAAVVFTVRLVVAVRNRKRAMK